MGLIPNTAPATKPEIFQAPVDWLHPEDPFRMHWYGEPGHQADANCWTPAERLGWTIDELTVHWSEENTPAGQSDDYYLQVLAKEAIYHAFTRDWNDGKGPVVHGDTIMYHYAITPPNEQGAARIIQLTAETRRTWNARAANSRNIAIMLMAGWKDKPQTDTVRKLYWLLDWFSTGRADLPLVTPVPISVAVQSPGGPTVTRQSRGVLTHDESLKAQGQPLKNCCGIYRSYVAEWREGWAKLLRDQAA